MIPEAAKTNPAAEHQIEWLDFLRGLAIISVLSFHTLGTTFGFDALPWSGWWRDFSKAADFIWFIPLCFGQIGVAIFFVISGFCIHWSFEKRVQGWREFFLRRFFRIVPPYLAALLFSILIIVVHTSLGAGTLAFWHQLLTHLFLVHNFSAGTFSGFNGSFWSLAVEAQLYLLYPVLRILVGRWGWKSTLILLGVCECAIRCAEGTVETINVDATTGGQIVEFLCRSPLGYWFSWTLGAWLAEKKLRGLPVSGFGRISPLWWGGLAVASYFVRPLFPFLFVLAAVLTSSLIARRMAAPDQISGKVTRLARFMSWIGLWSYSLYLLHEPLLQVYSSVVIRIVPADWRTAPLTFVWLLALWPVIGLLAILWYQVIELSSIAIGKSYSTRLSAKAGEVSGPGIPMVHPRVRAYGVWLLMGVAATLFVGAQFMSPAPAEENNQAWKLATAPLATARNGPLAVNLAEDACRQTHYGQTMMVGTLAAAYAEAGRFNDAVSTADLACQLAGQKGETNLLQRNSELRSLYLQQQPYHENAGK